MRIASILSAALALGLSVVAQTPQAGSPQSQNPIPVIHANTHAVVVDVVVTKGQDEPVTALHKQDFQLMEDGKPQPIDFFEEHTTVSSPAGAMAPLPKMPANVYTNVPAAPLTDSVNVLLLDSLNTPRPDQSYIHQQILAYLKTMKPATRIAIFTLGSKLRMVQGFTDDPALLQAALNDKNYGFSPKTTDVSRGRTEDNEDKAAVAAKAEAFGGGTRGGGGRGMGTAGVAALQASQAELAEFQADQRVALTLDALRALGRYLAGIPGRKNLIWFASSYPVYFFPKSGEHQPFNDRRENTDAIKQTADLLTLSKVAVYPIDAEGMMNDHWMDADNSGSPSMGDYRADANKRADTMSAMEQIAADTGGEAIFNTNDLNGAVNHAINNGAHYYTIVYTPANKEMDGQFRHIQIKVNPGKYKLSYRRGYYADDSEKIANASFDSTPQSASSLKPDSKSSSATAQQASLQTIQLQPPLVRGMPAATQVLYAVRVQPASPQPASSAKRAGSNAKLTGPTTRYVADFLIDWKKVQLRPGPMGSQAGKIHVELLAYDRDGKALNWTGGTMVLNLTAATYAEIQKTGILAHAELDLPQTDVYLATGVYDLEAGKAGTLEVPIDATAAPKTQAAVTPPAAR
jgi:VWFA-related protein